MMNRFDRKFSSSALLLSLASAGAMLFTVPAPGQQLPANVQDDFHFRSIGPAVFGGRITDIDIAPDRPFTLFVASASGGLYRTVNNGTTWTCIFDTGGTISIGDIKVDPTDPDVIWVGMGEANNQRSSYWGDGIYKTTDGGETWTHLGLPETHHIGRIVLDPNDTDTAYVAAVGHLYTSNPERGVFKTIDGGKTWKKVLYINEHVGVTDVVINPKNPKVLYAASYERLRRPWHFDGAGPGSGIYRSTDAGRSWERLKGGLPEGEIGRIGLDIYHENPDIVYATVSNQNTQRDASDEREAGGDSARPDLGFKAELTTDGWKITEVVADSTAAQAGLQRGDVITRIDEVKITSVWSLLQALSGKKSGDEVAIHATRAGETIDITIVVQDASGGGGRDTHGIPSRIVGGEIYKTEDAGTTWKRMNEQPVGGSPPYYYGQIRIDQRDPERLYVLSVPLFYSDDGGKTWQGNLAGSVHVDHHAMVVDPENSDRLILGNDGGLAISYDRGKTWDHYSNLPFSQFYAVGIDFQYPYHVYGGTQDNGTWGGPNSSRARAGVGSDDWYRVGGGDGFYAQVDPTNANIVYGESQFGVVYRLNKENWTRTGIRPQQREEHEDAYRFNWNSPILISHHNPEIIYFGGNRLFKSFNRGDSWPIVSKDLTTADPEKIKGNVPHCTITTIAESPINPNLLMVGTDDGLVQVSEDGGVTWANVTNALPDLPGNWWCSRVEWSRHKQDVGYASFTGYREDDFRPLLYKTEDRGKTWTSIVGNLPDEPINVVREDPRNANVLWIGTEMGAWVTIDAGATWSEVNPDFPTLPVHDLAIHPRERDVILATHGRGFFVADIGPLQELTGEVLEKDAHLFTVEDAIQWNFISNDGWSGDGHFYGENAPYGASISYHLGQDVAQDAISLVIEDAAGNKVATLEPKREAGLHRINWSLRETPEEGERRRRRRPQTVDPGRYTVVLTVGERTMREAFNVRRDPMLTDDDTPNPPESGSHEEPDLE